MITSKVKVKAWPGHVNQSFKMIDKTAS